MATLIQKISDFTRAQAVVFYLSVVGFVLVVFALLFGFSNLAELTHLEEERGRLRQEIDASQGSLARLGELRRENLSLQRRLAELNEQLPSQDAVEGLLKQVDELGRSAGLSIRSWRPVERRKSASGFYMEIPVDIEVVGGYHALRLFFDKVSRLPRIINVSSLQMGEAPTERDRTLLRARFLATAFAAQDEEAKPSGQGKTP